MKSKVVCLLYVCIFSVFFLNINVSADDAETKGWATSYVNLHSEPSFDSEVVVVLEPGREFTVFESGDPSWCFIYLASGGTGYVNSDYVTTTKNEDQSNENNIETKGWASSYVNLHSEPSFDSEVVVVLEPGREFTVFESGDPSWCFIYLTSGGTGYVNSDYVNKSNNDNVSENNYIETRGRASCYVNLHSEPSFNSDIVLVLESGRTFSVFDSGNNDWCYVYLDTGAVGYINPNYVTITRRGTTDNFGELLPYVSTEPLYDKKLINNVPYINQNNSWPTGCEVVSAVMALRYMGVDISPDTYIDHYLPIGEIPYYSYYGMVGGNPWNEFLGDPKSYDGWGCYAPVIKNGINAMNSNVIANDLYGKTLEEICANYIDNDIPVILWATIDMAYPFVSDVWSSFGGETIQWIYPNHCLLLTGYDDNGYYFHDPMVGQYSYYSKWATKIAYEAQGSQAIVLTV